jgi:hypothetical protein
MPGLKDAVSDVAEVVIFENWLRYYFIEEGKEGALVLRIPDSTLEEIKEKHEHLHPLAEELNGREMDYKKSQEAVCSFVARMLDGTKYSTGTVVNCFDSKDLKMDLHLFGLWQQGHEERLDAEYHGFQEWMDFFSAWRNTDEVKNYRQKILEASNMEDSQGDTAVQ